MSRTKVSKLHYFCAFLVAVAAALAPLVLIVAVLKGSDLVSIPKSLNPAVEAYRAGIDQLSKTSDSLITIDLAILAANVVWYLKDAQPTVLKHTAVYFVFLGCVVSLYFGIKLGYMAGVTLASAEPDILPLLSSLQRQAVATLAAGLLLTGAVVFGNLTSTEQQ